ncbi:hypothetical protein PR202_ga02025 [Eleusine coracana subsp. coracana]|uniref:Glycolipid transfer protein domain-containing protein n=1 Tax=Eleusine coracana subsp. coracana TaxID=191504 RepID=A0AAV5BIL8_ELECO|nr:hypothetical protein PR202_ga01338 [Eleusine coracana subsp. coracana]GJM86192.1 hypothetical protein PR202_ga02025 [Eleusine coracana subsp. coracana]
MAETVFTPSLEGMKHVKSENGVILTKPFLDVCKQILPVLDKFGAAMALVKTDIGGNITHGSGRSSKQDCKRFLKLHKWTSMAHKVAMKLAPNREKFMEVISGTGDIKADIEKFCTTFSPLLKENHDFLASVGLDDMKAS